MNNRCSTASGAEIEDWPSANDRPPHLWMHARPTTPKPSLSDNQRASLAAMITYTAHKSGQSEFRLERLLSDRFTIPSTKYLAETDFDEAIHYLSDIAARKN